MHRVMVASASERDNVLEFLELRGLPQNVWLANDVQRIGSKPEVEWQRVIVCRSGAEISGVASVCWDAGKGVEHGYAVRMESADAEAVRAILGVLPQGTHGKLRILSRTVQTCLDRIPRMECCPGDLYFTVSPEQFVAIDAGEITKLTANDTALFEGSEQERSWECRPEGEMVLGIVLDGKVASSISICPITPVMPSGCRAVSIGGLYTESRYRRMGLAERLVSCATEMILADGNIPIYWTEPENIASQALCQGLGYQRFTQHVTYSWRGK